MPTHVIIDFDSTFVQLETLDELAKLALADAPDRETRVANIAWITKEGMEGRLGFGESLSSRLAQFEPTREQVAAVATMAASQVSPSLRAHRELVRANAQNIWIVSGGFTEIIQPVVAEYGIAADHILANRFIWDDHGWAQGCDLSLPLAHDGGKVAAVRRLGLSGRVLMVGDGTTDLAVRTHGLAKVFLAFTETVDRPAVSLRADIIAPDFSMVARTAGWIPNLNLTLPDLSDMIGGVGTRV